MIGKNFLIVSILILVLSITPISAVEISENNGTDSSNSSEVTDSLISAINSDEKELQSSVDKLNISNNVIDNDLSYIKSNWWKFWKWGNILDKINDINSETQKIASTASELNVTASRMQINSEQLEKNSKQDALNQNPNDLKDANQMISKLNKRLNIVINTTNSNNLTEGDIVQYKSQNKYYHYLKYIKTENNNVILEGSKKKVITVSQDEFNNGTSLKLITNTSYNNSKIINEAYKIQNAEVRKQIDDTRSKQTSYKGLAISGTVIGGIGTIILIIGFTVMALAFALIGFTISTSAAGMISGAKICGTGFVILGLGGLLLIIGLSLLCEEDKKLKKLNDMLTNLEFYDDGLNHAPIAENINLTTNGTSLNGTLNATDMDDDKLNFTIINQPVHGTLKLEAGGNFSYTANNDSNGTDSFTYIANDGKLNSNNATVTLNTHIPPIANNMNLTTKVGKNTSSTFNVTDLYGSKLNYTIISNPEHGTLNYTPDGNFIYLPYLNYTGNDSFTYNVNDGFFNSNIAVTNITVYPGNPPLANNMTVITKNGKSVNKAFNITDVDIDKLTITIIRQPLHGNVNLTEDGKFIYTPNLNFVGTDFFTYLGNDGFFNSNTATVFIKVNR